MFEYLKHLVIRTPLEGPLHRLRWLAGYPRRRRHPELAELYAEPDRIEQMLGRLLKPTSNCLDVGGHLGSFTSLLVRLAPQGRHMTFEALPDKARWLKEKFPEVEVTHAAVGEAPGEITFYRNTSRTAFSGMNVHTRPGDKVEEIKVRCERLDDRVPPDRHVDFVKIDVEGAELSVLRGAREVIARCRPVLLFECALDGLEGAGVRPQDIFGFLTEQLGYEVLLVRNWLSGGAALTGEEFHRAMRYPFQARNFVAVPAERKAAAADRSGSAVAAA